MPAISQRHNPVEGFPKRFGCIHLQSRIGVKSRALPDKPIETGILVRCGAVFWHCSVELHFTRPQRIPIVVAKNTSNPEQAATLLKAL
jgi:hypothetical protein